MTLDGRKILSRRLLPATLLFALSSDLPAFSQETSAPPAFLLQIESTLSSEDAADWAEAAAITAKAHAKHPDGNMWATYRKLTGGPDETVRTFFALDKMGDLDSWRSNREIVTEVLGKDRARIVLADLELTEHTSESVLSYSAKLSHPGADFRATRYAWVVEVQVEEGKMTEYSALAKRLVDLEAAGQSISLFVYGTALGGDRSTLHYFYGFDEFAEVDAWRSRLELASESLGESEAARLLAAIDAISQTTTAVWQLEAELSHLQPK